MPRFPFSLFSKAIPAASVPTSDQLESSAWTVEVINSLSEEYASLAKPYTENAVVKSAVEAMRRNAGRATVEVGYLDDDGGFECVDHPLTKIWANPAIGETEHTLLEHIYINLLEWGNAFIQLVPDSDLETGGRIRELQPLPTAWLQNPPVTILGDAISEVRQYTFRGWDWGRQYFLELPTANVMHFRTGRSLTSMAFGRTPLESCRPELALIKLVAIYETTILSRAGVPSWLVSLLGPAASSMTNDQLNKLKYDMKNSVSGKKVTSPLVFPGGEMKIQTPGFSPRDLSVQELAEMAVARVCGVLGWAPMSLKQPDTGKTYSNLIEANKASWRDAVIPFLDLISGILSRAVKTNSWAYDGMRAEPDAMLSVRFNVEQVEELAADAKALSDRLIALVNAGIITVNEARADLGMEQNEAMNQPADVAEEAAEGEESDSQEAA